MIELSPSRPLARGLRRLVPQASLIAGLSLLGLILLLSFVGPFLIPGDPFAIHPDHALSPPGAKFWLGTDELGHDAFLLLLAGGFSTLIVALPAALLAFVAGLAYGLAAGLAPFWLDRAMMRLLDTILALPSLVVLIFFAALVTLDDASLILLLGLLSWPGLARLVRNEARAQRGRDFVHEAEQLGAGPFYVARVHLARAMAPMLVVNATFMVGDSIFSLSALSFLGLGVQPPQVSWGSLLQQGLALMALDPWWLILPPGLLIFAALLATSLIGQALLRHWGEGA